MTPHDTTRQNAALDPAQNGAGGSARTIRPGEISVPLPHKTDAALYFIGRIRSPWKDRKDCPKNAREARESGATCTIEIDPRWQQALAGVESCSHLIVLYWLDQSRRDLVFQSPAHYRKGRGTFALRSPMRPNPIGLAVVQLLKIEGCKLQVLGLDCLDGTPLLDIKPYFASADSIPDATVGWHAEERA